MIILAETDLHDQAGMERAFRYYFEESKRKYDGMFNTMMNTRFESCDYASRSLTLSMETLDWMSNPSSILHGGVTAAVLDMTMGLLCRYCSGGRMTPTVSMDVSYLRSAPLHRRLFIRADVTRCGGTICSAVGRLWLEGEPDRLLATSSGTYFVTKAQG